MTTQDVPFPRWAGTQATAEHINVSESHLNNMRVRGDGPPFVKMGRKVLYDLNEVDAWLCQKRRRSTTEGEAA